MSDIRRRITINHPGTNNIKYKMFFTLSDLLDSNEDYSFIKYDTEHNVIGKYIHANGVLHSYDKPAMVKTKKSIITEKWFINGINYNPNGPSMKIYNPNETYIRQQIYTNEKGLYHNDNGPAVITQRDKYYVEEYYKNGKLHNENGPAYISIIQNVRKEIYYIDDKVHRTDGPAMICYLDDKKIKEKYVVNGKYYRENGPTVLKYKNEKLDTEKYLNKNGDLHREDGPALRRYFENGLIAEENYYINGKLHREDGPALILYLNMKYKEQFYINGKLQNRNDKPNVILYDLDTGYLRTEMWLNVDGKLHRDDGPACIEYHLNEDGSDVVKISEKWYTNGVLVEH